MMAASNLCTMCGLPIPPDQNVCSMCYGDIDYGSDGYYEEWTREQERHQWDREQEWEASDMGNEVSDE